MSWTHEETGRWPCICKKGDIIVVRHEADNGWSKDYNTVSFSCGSCSALYTVEVSNDYGPDKVEVRSRADRSLILHEPQPRPGP